MPTISYSLPIYRRKPNCPVSFTENELSSTTICIYFIYHYGPWNNKDENGSKESIIADYRQFLFIPRNIAIELYETVKNSCKELRVNVNNARIIINKIWTLMKGTSLHDPTKKYHCNVFDTLLLKKKRKNENKKNSIKRRKILQKTWRRKKEREKKKLFCTIIENTSFLTGRSRAEFTPRKRRIDANFSKARPC